MAEGRGQRQYQGPCPQLSEQVVAGRRGHVQAPGQTLPAAAARRAATLVRRRVDSPGESKLRLCLVLAGLPEPECNITLGTDDRPIGRVDLLLEAYRLILEYEGDQHRTDRRQWNIDINRVEELSAEGYRVPRITAAHMRQPRVLLRRVHAALVAGGYTGPEPVLTAEWSALFERIAR